MHAAAATFCSASQLCSASQSCSHLLAFGGSGNTVIGLLCNAGLCLMAAGMAAVGVISGSAATAPQAGGGKTAAASQAEAAATDSEMRRLVGGGGDDGGSSSAEGEPCMARSNTSELAGIFRVPQDDCRVHHSNGHLQLSPPQSVACNFHSRQVHADDQKTPASQNIYLTQERVACDPKP